MTLPLPSSLDLCIKDAGFLRGICPAVPQLSRIPSLFHFLASNNQFINVCGKTKQCEKGSNPNNRWIIFHYLLPLLFKVRNIFSELQSSFVADIWEQVLMLPQQHGSLNRVTPFLLIWNNTISQHGRSSHSCQPSGNWSNDVMGSC